MNTDVIEGLFLTIEPQRVGLLRVDDVARAIKGLRNAYYSMASAELQLSTVKNDPISFQFVGPLRKDREWAAHLVDLVHRLNQFLDTVLQGRMLEPFSSKEGSAALKALQALMKFGDWSKCDLTVQAINGDDTTALKIQPLQAKRALKLIAAQSKHRKGSRTRAGQSKLVQEIEKLASRKDEESLIVIRLFVNILRENKLGRLVNDLVASLNDAGQSAAAKRVSEATGAR